MVQLEKLEGPALEAFLKMADIVKMEAARVNGITMAQGWGPNGALQLVDLLPAHLGVGTLTSTTHYGYRFSVTVGAVQGLFNIAIPASRCLGVYGWVDGTPGNFLNDQYNVTIGGRLARQWPAKPGQQEINQKTLKFNPFVVPATKVLVITHAVHAAAGYTTGGPELTFLGLYAEPKP